MDMYAYVNGHVHVLYNTAAGMRGGQAGVACKGGQHIELQLVSHYYWQCTWCATSITLPCHDQLQDTCCVIYEIQICSSIPPRTRKVNVTVCLCRERECDFVHML